MSASTRGRNLLTLLVCACSAAVAITGVILGAESDSAGAAVLTHAKPAVITRPAAGLVRAKPATSPILGDPLWVDPNNMAAKARATAVAQGHTADAANLAKISGRPTATWLTGDLAKSVATVQRVVAAAAAAHQIPVFVTYYLPNRDCGSYSGGGASSAASYQSWVRAVAAGLGSQRAIVIVEPDAIAMAAARSCASVSADRVEPLLADAVTVLKRQPGASVYLDAGNSSWISNAATLAAHLKASGLAAANGFALNVSNFKTLADSLSYGNKISAAAGGAHYLVDTSRNGAGPLPAGTGYQGPSWCNPPGRALGQAPSTRTGQPLVDAYLWVKYPGASDGSCGLGDPAAGVFWPAYAIGLAQRS